MKRIPILPAVPARATARGASSGPGTAAANSTTRPPGSAVQAGRRAPAASTITQP